LWTFGIFYCHLVFCFQSGILHQEKSGPGGVAKWTSHPPQEQEDMGSNSTRVYVFQGKIVPSAVVYK
jgi:hypothetical protein